MKPTLKILFAVLGLSPALSLAAEKKKAEPEVLPANVEKLVIKTSSSALREIPFYVRLPKSYDGGRVHRVLFICPVHNGNGLKAVTGQAQTKRLIEVADERNWVVVSATFDQDDANVRDRKTFYYYPETFSGKAVLEALAQVKRKVSIDTENLLLQGFSGGAQFVHRFAIWAPERVVAVAVNSSSWFDAPKETSRQTAWLLTIGDSDGSYDQSLIFVEQLRKVGAAPLFRSYAGMVHEGSGSVDKLNAEFLKYYDELTRSKLGVRRSLLATKPEPPLRVQAMPFLGDGQDWRYYKNELAAAELIPEDSRIYLPSENIAKLWGKPDEEP